RLPLGGLAGDLAADRREPALQVPQAGLARVRADQGPYRALAEGDLLRFEAVFLDLLRDQVRLRDLDLLLLRVAGQVDHLLPSEVFPTPGGPTKQSIGPFPSGLSLRTDRYSRIRSLILSRPKWSWSRIVLAALRSRTSLVSFPQGRSLSHSM